MDKIVELLLDSNAFNEFAEKYFNDHSIDPDNINAGEEREIYRELVLAYVPEIKNMNHDQLIEIMMHPDIDAEIVFLACDIDLTKEEAIQLIKKSRYIWSEIIKKYPEYFDRDLVEKCIMFESNIENFGPYIGDYPEIFEGIYLAFSNENKNINIETILKLPLSKEQVIRIISEYDFYYKKLDEKYLQDEDIVVALLKSNHSLPKNFKDVPASILVKHVDLVIERFADSYDHELFGMLLSKDERILDAYIKSGNISRYVLGYIDISLLHVLEENIDLLEEKINVYNLVNEVTKHSAVFLMRCWKSRGLNDFDQDLVLDNIEAILKAGLDLNQLSYRSNNILSNPKIIRKIIDYQLATTSTITIIEQAQGEALSENLVYAIEKGYQLTNNSPRAMFGNEGVARYLLDNNNIELLKLVSPEIIEKYADEICKKLDYQDGMYLGNLAFSPTIMMYIIRKTGSYDVLSSIYLRAEDGLDKWIPFVQEIYALGFRMTETDHNYFITWQPKLMLEYIKLTHNPNDIFLTYCYDEDLLNYVADLGFVLNDRCYGDISCNDKIIRNTIMYGDFNAIDYIGRPLTDAEVEIIYQRGYRLKDTSSYFIRCTPFIFIKEMSLTKDPFVINYSFVELDQSILKVAFDLGYFADSRTPKELLGNEYIIRESCLRGHAECLNYVLFVPANDLVDLYFNQGNIMDEKASEYLRQNPYAIHLMLQKTNNPNVIDLAIIDINEEDFKKALDLGYTLSDKTPIQLLNNERLMSVYLASELAKHPENAERLSNLASKIGAVAVCSALTDLLNYHEFIHAFNDIEIEKVIKFVYLVDTKDQLLTIVHNGNSQLLKQVYDICARLNSNQEFDVIMFKQIVNNFSKCAVLCANFVNSNYTREDIKLLYKVVVDGARAVIYEENNEDELLGDSRNVATLEELRNYKESTHFDTNTEINRLIIDYRQGFLTSDQVIRNLKNIIFKILCNKNYEEINVLLNQFLNTNRIEELLGCIKNPNIRNELENYKVFIDLIEAVFNMNDMDSLVKLAAQLNDKALQASEDIDAIWASFKNIEGEAKSFYGEEIRESIMHFDTIEDREGVSIVTGAEERVEDAPVIVTKGKYGSDGFEYGGRTYSGTVDLIELNGIPFVTFVHTLNAFGGGARVADFKNPRLVGRTYICISALSDEYVGFVRRGAPDIDHVSVLFSDFSSDQLAMASERDIYSGGGDNDLRLTSHQPSNLHPVRQVINSTYHGSNGYNEYVFYREDSQGRVIYPSAVLVAGDEPNEAEIQAAIYLGVPLVKINEYVYDKKREPGERLDITPSRKTRSIEEWKELRKSIDVIRTMVEPTEDIAEHKIAL